ncbi:MAG: NAD(P)-dependent oxidoreductase [Bacteroidales bacterium]|jgi:UDP-glucose 4-epimerase|nr:NAD(P)-dependent oxidoreductase [Bacteroidales bacterium]
MIIIIGATGFIGTYLTDALIKEGHNIIAAGRRLSALKYYKDNDITCVEIDITQKDDFLKLPTNGIDAVILLAALLPANTTIDDPYAYVNININGTLNVLEYCKKANVKKLISTTSYADIQGYWTKDIALKDDTPRFFNLRDDHACYIISKNAATDFILHYNEKYDMKGVVFRLPPVYGVGPHSEIYVDGKLYKSGFQIFLEKAINGEIIEINGDKNVSRDIVSVKDVVSAFIKVIKSDNAIGIYNISSGVAISLEEQVQFIIEVFSRPEKKSTIKYCPEKINNSKSYLLDISKAKKDFEYNPQLSLFKDLLIDYKNELENRHFTLFFEDRKKR